MNEQILNIIGKLLAVLFLGLLAYLTPKVKAWLEVRTNKDTTDILLEMIRSFVQAADQLYHDTDPTGTIRMQFVKDQLKRLEIEVTESVINMIEGEVWAVNTATKKDQTQAKALAAGEGGGNG